MSDDARSLLAQQQAELARALCEDSHSLQGFDRDRLQATSDALHAKRLRGMARAWPGLAESLGDRLAEEFAAYAAATHLPSEGGPLADGHRFATWLAARGELSDQARLERLDVDLHFFATAAGLFPRRWPMVTSTYLAQSGRLVLAAIWPGWGQWRCTVPFGWLFGRD